VYGVRGPEAVHVDAAVLLQLAGELGRQRGVVLRGEVAQGVAQGELLLLGCEDVLAARRMRHRGIERAGRRQFVGDAGADGLLERVEIGGCRSGHRAKIGDGDGSTDPPRVTGPSPASMPR
jgi:hypothetical protein